MKIATLIVRILIGAFLLFTSLEPHIMIGVFILSDNIYFGIR